MAKGILFAGDSYTWGEGLQYFSGLDTVHFPEQHTFNPDWITKAQMRFIETNRFSTLVARKFNTYDINYGANGGSDLSILGDLSNKVPDEYGYSELSAIVVQLTNPLRDRFTFEYNGIEYDSDNINQNNRDTDDTYLALAKLVNEKYDGDFSKFEVNEYKKHLEILENLFVRFENNGIVCRWINWLEDGYEAYKNNEFLRERAIEIVDNGIEYKGLRNWLKNNKHYFIRKQFEHINKCQQDEHTTPAGHNLIAQNIFDNLNGKI